MDKNTSTSHWNPGKYIIGNILVFSLLILVIEGLASYLLFARDAMTTIPLAERQHTQYDSDLGWVNIPDMDIPDMYGPGISLRTNSQGFRNDYNFDESTPVGKKRIICSGDSFTLGYGVDNDHTWCQQLTALDPRIETVNMAQGGYGVDQAYLWYMRDGTKIKHDIQILAFITDDFYRMQRSQFLGYSKPVLATENGALVIRNTPVPKTSYIFSSITSMKEHFSKLRTFELISRMMRKINVTPDNTTQQKFKRRNEETRDTLIKIFQALNKSNIENNSKLVLVYLPTKYELDGIASPEEWMEFIGRTARSYNIPVIDIMKEFQSMDQDEAAKLFIQSGELLKYPGAAGHLNDAGNEMVAKIIHGRIKGYLLFSQ